MAGKYDILHDRVDISDQRIDLRHWFNPQKKEIVIMGPPRKIHECLTESFLAQTVSDCSKHFDPLIDYGLMVQALPNSMIASDGIPDFQLVLNVGVVADVLWIGEVGFSSTEAQMKKKLEKLVKPSTYFIFLVNIVEERYREPDDSTPSAQALRARGPLTFEEFSEGYCVSFEPVNLHGFHWMALRAVRYRVSFSEAGGEFNLDSNDPAVAATGVSLRIHSRDFTDNLLIDHSSKCRNGCRRSHSSESKGAIAPDRF